MHILYRISGKINRSGTLGHIPITWSKLDCLYNFLKVFNEYKDKIYIIGDYLGGLSLSEYKLVKEIHVTELGNCGSFRYALSLALTLPPDEIVYFVEDDYIHTVNSPTLIQEGLTLADYVSLCDIPDKYSDQNRQCSLSLGKSRHWRTTPSTYMTFAAKVKTLQQDKDTILNHVQDSSGCPMDDAMFRSLGSSHKRVLMTPIPGACAHICADLSPFVDWQQTLNSPI